MSLFVPLLEFNLGAACAEHDGVAFGGKVLRRGFADSTARAGDQNDFGFNLRFHHVCGFLHPLISIHAAQVTVGPT